MPRYEYKVVPAPTKGLKAKGLRGAEARFSNALEQLINDIAGEGWEYQRAETLPSVERSGLTSTTTEWRHVLIFRRPADTEAEAFKPELLPPPDPTLAAPNGAAKSTADPAEQQGSEPSQDPTAAPKSDAAAQTKTHAQSDYEEDNPDEIASFSPSLKQLFEDIKSKKSAD